MKSTHIDHDHTDCTHPVTESHCAVCEDISRAEVSNLDMTLRYVPQTMIYVAHASRPVECPVDAPTILECQTERGSR